MKKILSFVVLSLLSICITYAQAVFNETAISKQVASKAKTFCQYVVNVGTTPGQTGAVSDAVKNDIIRNRVPGLFWDYYEAPRKMLTTNGPNGNIIKKRKMYDYFNNLKAQANSGLNQARTYELHYVGIVPSVNEPIDSKFVYKCTLSDGCKLYGATIRIEQVYHVLTFTPEGTVIVKEEFDVKDYEVNVVVKPSGKSQVFLGDVKRAKRKR